MTTCMGKNCKQEARYTISSSDESLALHKHPVHLCYQCIHTKPLESSIDIFLWLADFPQVPWVQS